MTTARQLRRRIDATVPGGRGRRFSRELKAEIVEYTRAARADGERAATIETDLNISWPTISRWLKFADDSPSDLVRVVAVGVLERPTEREFSLVSPTGWRVDGLTASELRTVIAS
jgi:hypothetical protein